MTGSQGVKRYTVEEVGIGPFKRFEMGENPYGEYVKASDYDRLAALMPREWTAETIKDAPEGVYTVGWGEFAPDFWCNSPFKKSEAIVAAKKFLRTFKAFGPIPQPPTKD